MLRSLWWYWSDRIKLRALKLANCVMDRLLKVLNRHMWR